MKEGVFETTLDGRLLEVNGALARLFGYQDATDLLQSGDDVESHYVRPADREELLARLRAGDTRGTFRTELRNRSGAPAAVEISWVAVRGEGDRPVGLRGTVENVTAVVESQRELQTVQEQLRIAFHDNPVGQILIDLSGESLVVTRANRALETMLGYGPGEMAGAEVSSFVHPDDVQFEGGIFDRCLAGADEEVAYRTRRRHRSGTWIPVYIAGRVVRDTASGAPSYALATVVDITAELEAEEELRVALALAERSQRTLQALVDNAPAAIYMLDAEGRFTLVNQEFERMLGASRSAILGQTWDAIPARSAGVVARHGMNDHRLLAGDAPQSFQEDVPFEEGARRFVSVDFPVAGADRRLLGIGGISTDITALTRAENSIHGAWRQTLRRIADAVEYRDEETGAHIERMASLCGLIATELGLPVALCSDITAAAVLHDAGKIAVPDRILRKPGRLTEDERRIMETHAAVGHQLLSGSGSPLLDLAASIAWTHHERYDGTGYPRGLAGCDIPLEGRIAAVADVFDSLTNDRVYRPAFSVEEALTMMRDQRGRHFDPQVLDALLGRLDDAIAVGIRFGALHAHRLRGAA